jgi:hypothetical protein
MRGSSTLRADGNNAAAARFSIIGSYRALSRRNPL